MRMTFGQDYPQAPPKGETPLLTPPLHPCGQAYLGSIARSLLG